MLRRLITVGIHHRLLTLLFLLAMTFAAALGLPKLRVETGFDSLIALSDPNLKVLHRVTRQFGSDRRVFVYVRDAQLWTPDKLAVLERLHYELEGLDFVQRVDDLFTLRSIRGRNGQLDVRTLLPESPRDQAAADLALEAALYNPLIMGNQLSEDGRTTVLMAVLHESLELDDQALHQALERMLAGYQRRFDELFQVSTPRIQTELETALFEDMTRLGPLSAGVLVLTILLFLRSLFGALVPLLTSAVSLVWAFGLMGWAGIPLNILSAMLPSLVIVIGSTEDTHLLASYLRGLAEKSGERRAAARFMLKRMLVPLLLTVLTTGLGFASNTLSSMGLVRDFAIASTAAIAANGLVTLLLAPMLLATFGPRHSRLFQEGKVNGLPGLTARLFNLIKHKYSNLLLLLTALACGFFLYHAASLRVSNDLMSYFRDSRPLVQQVERIHRDLAGVKLFYITLDADRENAFLDPANLRKLADIQAFLDQQGVFDRSLSLADFLSLVNREFHGGDPRQMAIPATRELVAQYLLFFHRNDLQNYVSHDYRSATILVRHNISDSSVLNRNAEELAGVVAQIAGGDLRAHVVGRNLMVNAAAESLIQAQLKSLGILLLAIFLIMSAMFTSIKGGLIGLVPALIPIILVFGAMGLLEIPLNPGTAMVAVIAIGIAVDGTIHLLSRYNELCRRTSDYQSAVRITVQEEATPLVSTSFALALGFSVLLFSNFTVIAQFGALSAATMLFSVFANLLITPLIMSRVRLIGLHQILALKMQQAALARSPLFQGMSNYQIRKAILISDTRDYEKDTLLIKQGTVGKSMYLLLSGQAEVIWHDGPRRQRIRYLNSGDVFGEIGFVGDARRTADVRAVTQVSVLRYDLERIRRDLKYFPRIVARLNFNISVVLGTRLYEHMEMLEGTRDWETVGGNPSNEP
jgi:predicted RND superfamily exporter protein